MTSKTISMMAVLLLLWAGTQAEAQNGFDTTRSLIFRGDIRSGGPPKDGIPALTNPRMEPAGQVNYLQDDDLVIGVNVGGDQRAYPLRIIVWHEIVNDTVGGHPIAVTYCPLCRSVLVFDRRVGDQVREFGVSGLLYNSNLLLYDRQSSRRQESLWSQAEMRAVTGPAAKEGLRLELLPSELTTWADWKARHPDTRALSVETGYQRSYHGRAYTSYFSNDSLMFPVRKKTKRPRRFKQKEMLAVIYADGHAKAYAMRDVAKAVGKGTVLEDTVGRRSVRLEYVEEGPAVRAEVADGGPPFAVAFMYWFTLSAMQPDVAIFTQPR